RIGLEFSRELLRKCLVFGDRLALVCDDVEVDETLCRRFLSLRRSHWRTDRNLRRGCRCRGGCRGSALARGHDAACMTKEREGLRIVRREPKRRADVSLRGG